jgi:tetratricopeptide (TPR) repeat protein
LFHVYRAADAIAEKHGYSDLSARIIGLLRSVAAETGDELVQASGSYVRGETFFSSGDLTTGRMMLERAAERIHVRDSDSAAATYGALHMRAAVMAARAGHAALATEHIDEATQIALRVNEGVHLGTAFGAASVRIHRLSLAVELGDFGAALRSATGWQPPTNLPAERRSHFYIDLGRAYYAAGQTERALDALHTAHCVAPEHIRAHPHVREMIEQVRIAGPGIHSTALSALQRAMS